MFPVHVRSSAPSRRGLLAAATLAAAGAALPLADPIRAYAVPAEAQPADPAGALRSLLAGNRRFVAGRAGHPRQSVEHLRDAADGQQPLAVILGCADSRVPPEILFDQGLGDLFDNRVAGNIADELLLGSVEYAVAEFAPPVVVVLGHERCGAITATIDAIRSDRRAPGRIGDLVEALRPIVEPVLDEPGDPVDNAVRANIVAQTRVLRRSVVIRSRVEAGRLLLVGARYDLDTGSVTLVG